MKAIVLNSVLRRPKRASLFGGLRLQRNVMKENYIEDILFGFTEYNMENSVVIPASFTGKNPLLPVGLKIIRSR